MHLIESQKAGTHIKRWYGPQKIDGGCGDCDAIVLSFGIYNIGHQHFVAAGEYLGFIEGFHLKLAHWTDQDATNICGQHGCRIRY
nr:hypothetical protein [Candidatus Brachybacter algidus]